MFIQTEPTPNPATVKFLPGCEVMVSGTAQFTRGEDTTPSPLASRLLAVDGVMAVFFGRDFVSVTKSDTADWLTLKTMVLGELMQHFSTGQPVMSNETPHAPTSSLSDDDDDIVRQIKILLDTRVRPAVAQDGGDIVFDRFDDGIVYLHMRGACAGCPSSTATLKAGIENMLKHYVPEVTEVRPATAE